MRLENIGGVSFDQFLGHVEEMLGTRRVVPPVPPSRVPIAAADEIDAPVVERDDSSSWTAYLSYVDAQGAPSERRFTCHAISGFGAATHITGICHERKALRTFRVDRIVELVCAQTGEVLEATPHFELMRQTGALKVSDKVLTDVVRLLVFLARCDSDYHPLEEDAVHQAIERYCLRFNGTDRMIEDAIAGCGRLAPDSTDVLRALKRMSRLPEGAKVCRFLLDSGAAVIDADGRHSADEIAWAVEMSNALKAVCAR